MTDDREQVIAALGDVFDPELGMLIVDLGLVYRVEIAAGRVPGAPLSAALGAAAASRRPAAV
jgi:hypothetical protein